LPKSNFLSQIKEFAGLALYVCVMKESITNRTIKVDQISMDFVLQADTNGPATQFEFTVPTGTKVPVTYYHEHFVETPYGLERIITFTIEGKAIDITPGESCFVPRGVVFSFDN
jgi:mannose-6-phosphate isomerase-like protein (cupin superfamily)